MRLRVSLDSTILIAIFIHKFQDSGQKPNQLRRRSSKLSRIVNVWALSCALDLGLLRESSLKEVIIASYSELNSLSTTEDAAKSPDLEADDREDDVFKSANIFGNSWPFIDPAQIKRIARAKPVRRRRKKTRWSVKRQRKPKGRIDDAIERSSSLRGSGRENLGVSRDRSARLSVRKNPSSTRSRVFVGDEAERWSESYRSTGEDDDDEEEVISQTTSETSSEEIAQVDYSGSGYSRFYSTSHTKEEPQNRMELSEYPDYFMNVLRIDNSNENNDLDTSEDDTAKDNARTAKFAKFAERRASRKILENGNSLHRTGRASRKKKPALGSSGDRVEMPKKRRNRSIVRKEKARDSAYNHYNRRRISRDLEENTPRTKSDSRDDVAAGTRDVAAEIAARKRCDCKARRRSHNFTNAACPCKKTNSRSTAAAIMRDIQECINTKIATDVEDIEQTISEIEKSMPKEPSYDDLRQDVSMEYDWVDSSELDNRNLSSQVLERSFDSTNAERSSLSVQTASRRRKRRNRCLIDCKFDESTATAYRSVFHDCIDFDTPRSRPSLKINMEESWRSAEDSSDNDDEIHSSWRRSTLGSSTEDCGNEVDGALLLARKIVNDDSTKDEKCDDEHETLNNACYKYRETSDAFTMARTNSFYDSDEDMEDAKFANEARDIITYRNKNRTIRRSTSVDYRFKDEDDDVKVSEPSEPLRLLHLFINRIV